jgi:single-stranded DNA-binding protein
MEAHSQGFNMTIQFLSRAKAEIIGELVEVPSFADTASGARYARIKIQTVEHFISKGERRSRKEIHDITVFSKAGVDLLTNFGKPGVHFLIVGKLSSGKIEVSQFGGEIYVMTTGEQSSGAAPSAGTSDNAGASSTKPATAAARPSGGLGRVGGRPAPSRPSEEEGYTPPSRSDAELDDDIPF